MAEHKLVSLRRTITPYVGQTVILSGVTIFAVYAARKASDWTIVWAALGVLAVSLSVSLYFGLKYRILWDETGVVMRASGGAERRLGYEEITGIRYELADSSEFLSQSRPFRRIVLYGRKHDPKAFIDISLRHFRLDEIEQLLTEIRKRRPDLGVPSVLVDGRVQTIRKFNKTHYLETHQAEQTPPKS